MNKLLLLACFAGLVVFASVSTRASAGLVEGHGAVRQAADQDEGTGVERIRPGEAHWSTNIGSLSLGDGAARATFENVHANCGMFQVMALLGQVRERAASCLQPAASPRITLTLASGRPTAVTAEPANPQGQCFVTALRGATFGSATCTLEFTARR